MSKISVGASGRAGTPGNGVEAEKRTVYYKISQEHHFGFYRKVIGDKKECVLVGIYPFEKKKSKESNSTIGYWRNR